MSLLERYIAVRSLWRTFGLLIAVAILASPDAPLPLLVLYGMFVVAAFLLPLRPVSDTAVLWLIGSVSILVGGWMYFWELTSPLGLAGFLVLGCFALLYPPLRSRF